jgi:hypothetical protein
MYILADMALSLTSLEDAYASDLDAQPPAQSVPAPAMPALPDHGKKERPVSLREQVPPADHGGAPHFHMKRKPRATATAAAATTESFTEKAWSHRKDMMKMLTLALIIATGLAFHHVFVEFLDEYLAGARLTYWNEKVAKLCYPGIVLALVWCLKSFK